MSVAIIPARSGSKSITDKNLISLAGHPLIAYSIAAAKLCSKVERVIVSTDSEIYAAVSSLYGAETPFLRPKEISGDHSSDLDFMRHAISWLDINESKNYELWTHLRPTTPLRTPEMIASAIEIMERSKKFTALRSVHEAPESPFKWFKKNSDGTLANLMGDSKNLDSSNEPRQSYTTAYIPNGYVDVIRSSYVSGGFGLHGNEVYAYETNEVTEIDSRAEFQYLEYQIKEHGSTLLNYLNKLKGI
jgi:CMP-N-acetylneuraminic acid synthetase